MAGRHRGRTSGSCLSRANRLGLFGAQKNTMGFHGAGSRPHRLHRPRDRSRGDGRRASADGSSPPPTFSPSSACGQGGRRRAARPGCGADLAPPPRPPRHPVSAEDRSRYSSRRAARGKPSPGEERIRHRGGAGRRRRASRRRAHGASNSCGTRLEKDEVSTTCGTGRIRDRRLTLRVFRGRHGCLRRDGRARAGRRRARSDLGVGNVPRPRPHGPTRCRTSVSVAAGVNRDPDPLGDVLPAARPAASPLTPRLAGRGVQIPDA
jgi:hypothetical protein